MFSHSVAHFIVLPVFQALWREEEAPVALFYASLPLGLKIGYIVFVLFGEGKDALIFMFWFVLIMNTYIIKVLIPGYSL
jgi:hypothetical protein